MSDVVIAVRNLSKQYRLGAKEKQADTFFGSLRNMVAAPFKNYKQIRNLTRNAVEDETLFWALRDINFEVKQGEVLGIIGHNGAGKSTLLKILSRITDPTTGEIMIKGRVSALLEVGTGFHPELTGRENVYMNGTILGMTKKEITRKFDEIIDFSGIEKHIDTPVKFYSSGMKVRLAFAVAAHLEPELLIIDEVLAVGDAEFQKKCIGKMEDVASEGRTVLFVSHNLNAVVNLCSRSILLSKGGILKDSTSKEVVDFYLSSKNSVGTVKHQGDEFLISIFASDNSGFMKPEFYFDDDITLNFTFKNLEYKSKLGLAVYDEFERRVFIDFFQFPSTDLEGVSIKACIPKGILTPGKYNVALSLMNPYEKVYWLRSEVLKFQISKLASKYEKLNYDFGVINLNIRWEF